MECGEVGLEQLMTLLRNGHCTNVYILRAERCVFPAVDEAVTPLARALRHSDEEYVVDLLPPVVSLELWLRLSTAISLPVLYGQSE